MHPLAVALLGLAASGCLPLAEQPVPVAYRDKVESARQSLLEHWDGDPRPTFGFVGVRCRSDGGVLVFFVNRGGRYDGDLAFAQQGPFDGADSWGGGFSIDDPETDPEVRAFFAIWQEIPCPPVPPPPL